MRGDKIMNIIIKRDGRKVPFDSEKIEKAILKAMKNGSGIIKKDIAKQIADDANELFKIDDEEITIEDIEDYVYFSLLENGEELTAKSYEGYRAIQSFKRTVNTTDKSVLELISFKNEDVMNENSNKNAMLVSTQRDLIAGEVSKDISKRVLIPTEFIQAHDDGVIHWHDMDYTLQNMFNCCLINLEDMLDNGTVINEKLVETPKSFSTACTVTTQIMAQVASNQYGGQSITIAHLAKYLKVSEDKAYKHFISMGIDEEKAKKLAEDLDLLDGLRLSVQHCEEVIAANKERYPILETTNRILTTVNKEIKADIQEVETAIAKLKAEEDAGSKEEVKEEQPAVQETPAAQEETVAKTPVEQAETVEEKKETTENNTEN